MANKKDFLDKFKLAKARPIVKGHKLQLYKTLYTVMDTNDKLTLLRDPNGGPVAYPTAKLKMCLAEDMLKSAAPAKPAAPSAPTPTPVGKMHAGKIRVDKVDSKGRKYHYWVDAQHGARHDDHSSPKASDSQLDHEDQKLHSKMVSVIAHSAHPADVEKLTKQLTSWVHEKAAYHNLREANNQLAREVKTGVPSSVITKLTNKQLSHEKKFKQLKEALAASSKRRKV